MLTGKERFRTQKDRVRKRLLKYTRKAFKMISKLDSPFILDIGCGTGVPTMELARLSDGEITALDIDRQSLEALNKKIEKAGIKDRVKAIKCSIFDMEFPDESFDIIWAEGSINVIGFERGLKEWKRFVKANGFLVVHDEQGDIEQKLKRISLYGYELLGYFLLDKDKWLAEYFSPLQELISEFREKYANDAEVLKEIQDAEHEIDIFKKDPERNSSACFVLKKR